MEYFVSFCEQNVNSLQWVFLHTIECAINYAIGRYVHTVQYVSVR